MEIKDINGKIIATVTAADPNTAGCDEGLWVELKADDGTRPTLCVVKDRPGDYSIGWYLGVYRDAKNPGVNGCDLAISFNSGGPMLQVRSGDKVKIVSLFDLIAKVA
jgi:hypothetical protein